MSLINEMLTDLEARRRAPPTPTSVLDGLTAAAAEEVAVRSGWSLMAAGLVVGAALVLAITPMQTRWLTQPARPDTPTTPVGALPRAPILPPIASAPIIDPMVIEHLAAPNPSAVMPAPGAGTAPVKVAPTPRNKRRSTAGLAEAARITAEIRAEASGIDSLTTARPNPPNPDVIEAAREVESPGSFRREPAQSVAQSPSNLALARALNLLRGGARTRGVAALSDYVKAHPREHRTRGLLATELIRSGQRARAVDVLESGHALAPQEASIARLLGHLYHEQGELAHAIEVLSGAAKAARDLDYQLFLAALLQQAERHSEAIEIYRSILAKQPAHGTALIGLAVSLTHGQVYREAQALFARAAAVDSLSPPIRQYASAEAARLERFK